MTSSNRSMPGVLPDALSNGNNKNALSACEERPDESDLSSARWSSGGRTPCRPAPTPASLPLAASVLRHCACGSGRAARVVHRSVARFRPCGKNGIAVAKPVVGITTYLTPASFGVWETTAVLVPQSYVLGVERAGGRALLVPPSEDAIEETLDALDGLIFSGGSDLDPDLYGQEPHAETNGIVPERDRAELALLTAALERDLPVLAICRGSQVLNVALGGDLIQHLPDLVGHERHKESPGEFSEHEVEIEPGSRLAGVLGSPGRREVAPPPGPRPPRRRPPCLRPRRRRPDRGARGPRPSVHGRRPLAPRGRRRPAPVRGARRRSGGLPRRPAPRPRPRLPPLCRTRSGSLRSGSRSGTRGSCASSGRRAARCERATSAFTGLITRKKRTIATSTKAISAFRKSP